MIMLISSLIQISDPSLTDTEIVEIQNDKTLDLYLTYLKCPYIDKKIQAIDCIKVLVSG